MSLRQLISRKCGILNKFKDPESLNVLKRISDTIAMDISLGRKESHIYSTTRDSRHYQTVKYFFEESGIPTTELPKEKSMLAIVIHVDLEHFTSPKPESVGE